MSYDQTLRYFTWLSGALVIVLFGLPWLALTLFGLDQGTAPEVITRRAGILFLGFFLLAPALRRVQDSTTRRMISRALAVMMLVMAGLGMAEWGLGRAGPGLILASITELAFCLAFLRLMKHPD
ncbi:hypothetical protein [Actibacterium sp.]|uniref:hypothetical protein n=1 Tax=Actibacterium sp. TaxID=1872125 RepID=UPI00356AB2E6